MNADRRSRLQARFHEISNRLALLYSASKSNESTEEEEGELLEELDSIEFELGLDEVLLLPTMRPVKIARAN